MNLPFGITKNEFNRLVDKACGMYRALKHEEYKHERKQTLNHYRAAKNQRKNWSKWKKRK